MASRAVLHPSQNMPGDSSHPNLTGVEMCPQPTVANDILLALLFTEQFCCPRCTTLSTEFESDDCFASVTVTALTETSSQITQRFKTMFWGIVRCGLVVSKRKVQ